MNLYRKPVKMRWTAPSRSFQNSAGRRGRFQSLTEPAVAVDGARRNGREKEEEGQELAGGERNDQAVPDAEDDVQAAERHVRDPQEPQLGAGDGQRQESGPDQGEQGQQQRRGEGPVPRGARPHPEESLGHDPLEDAAGHHHPDRPDLREPAGD